MVSVNINSKISNRFCLKTICLFNLLTGWFLFSQSQVLHGFYATEHFSEQEMTIEDQSKNMTININAPLQFHKKGKTYLVFYALPNGNSIEWTKGKKMKEGDNWHFDIQHIAAQTRFVRQLDNNNNYVVVYLMAAQKSWPTWKRTTPGSISLIKNIVDSISGLLEKYKPQLILIGHSGGGSFIFGYLDAVEKIPENVVRIAFLDSDYGYEDSLYTKKFVDWLQDKYNKLVVLAYNDSLVIYNGKPLVSPTGGTWYRTRLMQRKLAETIAFDTFSDTAFIYHTALKGRILIILKENPTGLIYHTVQVEKNGYILSLLTATKFDRRKYFTYFGERVYGKYISD